MKWETSITSVNGGDEIIRGKKLSGLIKNNSFTETMFLIWRGRLPRAVETKRDMVER